MPAASTKELDGPWDLAPDLLSRTTFGETSNETVFVTLTIPTGSAWLHITAFVLQKGGTATMI